MLLKSVACHYRIGYQRIGSHDTAEQHRGKGRIAQKAAPGNIHKSKGQGKGKESEQRDRDEILLQSLKVHLYACEKHDIQQSHPAEELKTGIALKNVEAILTQRHTSQHHAYDMGDTQLTHDDRCYKYGE